MLLARSHRQVDTERVAAFAKRLSAVRLCRACFAIRACSVLFPVQVAFHAETGEAMGALAVVSELLNRYQKLRRLLVRQSGALSLTPGSEHRIAGERIRGCPLLHARRHRAGERVCAVVVPVGGVAAAAPRAPLGCFACDARGLLACGGCRSPGSIRVK